jgi:hypothetical protein
MRVWIVSMAAAGGDSLPREREQQLVKALRQLEGRATLADVVRATGLPREQTEQDLRALLGLYRSHLAVDEDGELLYLFSPQMERRVSPPGLSEFLHKAWRWTVKAAVLGIKIAVMALLVFYVLAFCVLIIAALVALASADADIDVGDVSDGVGDGCLSSMGDFVFFWDVGHVAYVPIFDDGPRARTWADMERVPDGLREPRAFEPRYVTDRYQRRRTRKKRFHEEVFAFLFGPQVPDPSPMPAERELLAWIHDHKGVITMTELITRTGLSVDDAEQEMARLLSRYSGDVEVNDDGVLLYTFHGLKVTAQQQGRLKVEARAAPPAWHRFEPGQQLIGNSWGKNALIGGMAAFNLIMGALAPWLLGIALGGPVGWGAVALMTAIPVALSLLFFLAPLARLWGVSAENSRRYDRNLRRVILLSLFEHISRSDAPLPRAHALRRAQEQLAALQSDRPEEGRQMESLAKVSDARLEKVLDAVLAQMEAEIDTDDDGALLLSFPRQRAELLAADAARADTQRAVPIKELAYSSEDDHDDPLADHIDDLDDLHDDAEQAEQPEEAQAEATARRRR